MEGLDTELLSQKKDAETASDSINSLAENRALLNSDAGIISGSKLSVPETEFRKMASSLFGYQDDGVTNTEEYLAGMQKQALDVVKKLGTGNSISDADREFATKIVGASQDMPVASVKQLFRIKELSDRNQIIQYNQRVQDRINASKDANGQVDPTLAQVLKPIPVPAISDDVMNMVDPADLKQVAEMAKSGKIDPKFEHAFDYGTGNVRGYGKGAFQAVLDRIKAEGM
jgi:hypothetical protein